MNFIHDNYPRILFMLYVFSLVMATNFVAIFMSEIKASITAVVVKKRLTSNQPLNFYWGTKSNLVFALILAVMILCPVVNLYFAIAFILFLYREVGKIVSEGWTR